MDIDDEAAVLVCVLNRASDLLAIERDRWYRIPLGRAPRAIGCDYLAFYQTAALAPEHFGIYRIAQVLDVSIATRAALLPDEPTHPRAAERYYRLALGEIRRLPLPLRSARLRRISFIATRYGALRLARDVNELWWRSLEAEPDPLIWAGGLARR